MHLTQYITGFIILLTMSCQQGQTDVVFKDSTVSEDMNNLNRVSIPISFGNGLQLANTVASQVLTITGCASGYTIEQEVSSAEVSLYLYDRSCLAGLNSFELNGVAYTLQGSFNTGEGQSSTFIGPTGEIAEVEVTEQLSNPVAQNDSIGFVITRVAGAQDTVAEGLANVVIVEAVSAAVNENTGQAQFIIKKVTELDDSALDVDLIISGTADPVDDYVVPPMTVTIPAGSTSVTVTIELVDDLFAETGELLQVQLGANQNYYTYGTATTLILDTDTGYTQTGQVVLFDQSSMVVSGGLLTGWNDLSSGNNDGSQSSSSARPAFAGASVNGLDAALFDGSNDVIKIADSSTINMGGPYTEKSLIMAFKTSQDISRRQILWEQGGSVRGLSLYIENGSVFCNAWNDNNDDSGATTPWQNKVVSESIATDTVYIVAMRMVQNTQTMSCYLNGGLVGTASGVGKLFNHSDDIGLGGGAGGTLFPDGSSTTSGANFSGHIAEFLAYNVGLGDSDFIGVLEALNRKYGYTQSTVSLSVDKSQVNENGGESFTLTVVRNDISSQDLIVSYSLSGSAMETQDFAMTQGAITIPALSISGSETIQILDDNQTEGVENITVILSSVPQYTISNGVVNIQINDDEAFTPHSSISMWLTADSEVTLSGNQVTSWGDATDNQTVNQSNSSQQPLLSVGSLNGNNVISFDGVDDHLEIANSDLLNNQGPYDGKSFGFVIETGNNVNDLQVLYEQGGTSRGIIFYIENGLLYFNSFNLPNDDGGVTTPWSHAHISLPIQPNTAYSIIAVWDQPANMKTLSINDQFTSTTCIGLLFTHGGTIALGAVSNNILLHDGRRPGSTDVFGGTIAEVMFYNSALGSVDSANMKDYFDDKYGL